MNNDILDISQKKKYESKIENEHRYLQTVINTISDPLMIVNKDFTIAFANDAAKKNAQNSFCLDNENLKCYKVIHNRDKPCSGNDHICPLYDVMKTKKPFNVIHKHVNEHGIEKYVELAASPLLDENSECIGMVEISRNITSHIELTNKLKKQSELLNHQAHHDYLTGLPNRALFVDRLEQAIKDSKRDNTKVALFFIDMDYFKEINDTLGHDIGDEVLKETANRFRSSIRESDALFRIGGDEFTLIVKNINSKANIQNIANKLLQAFDEPIVVDGNILKISISIGISIYPEHHDEIDMLIKYADKAMYKVKNNGKNSFHLCQQTSPSI